MKILHVEVQKQPQSRCLTKKIEGLLLKALNSDPAIEDNVIFVNITKEELHLEISSIKIYDESHNSFSIKYRSESEICKTTNGHNGNSIHEEKMDEESNYKFQFHIYELNEGEEDAEYMDDEDENGGNSPASHSWILPSTHFDSLWDSLFFESNIKINLMDYVRKSLLYSEKGVNNSIIDWNKVILLHGPPGTGKTSLCKALAQKASIWLNHKYRYGQLVEINSHSLFSKWFSESGKLVMKMFDKIHELLEDPECLLFLLIDEVESLAKCRKSAEAGNEPSDSIRAVNALLTQIDKIKRYPNVVILTTSNMVKSIDLAFVDRADLKISVGNPPTQVISQILSTCISELIRVGIINDQKLNTGDLWLSDLHLIAKKCADGNLSGRTLRKLPFITQVKFIHSETCSLKEFLIGFDAAINNEIEANSLLNSI